MGPRTPTTTRAVLPHHDSNTLKVAAVSPGKFKLNPTNRDILIKCAEKWMEGKRIDDDIGPYWRIHNKLYDLTDFIKRHPGGDDWIISTRGTDITEAFESSHIGQTAAKILPKYYVCDIQTPRNSPFTFNEDGFYRTLKKKVNPILKEIGKGPTLKMNLMQDMVMIFFVSTSLAASWLQSYSLAVLAGILLGMTIGIAHNYFHQKNNYRMYYFDLSLLSSYQWRITHGISHHLFPNTIYDIEISAFEPFLNFLPYSTKNMVQRYGSWIYEFVMIPFIFHIEFIKRLVLLMTQNCSLRPENFLVLIEFFIMSSVAPSFWESFRIWMIIHGACSTWFLGLTLTVAHHHPDIYHEGDQFRIDDPDWGLCQLDAIRDRYEVKGNLFLISISFGDHTLHHLFPTVDHSKLDALYPAFFETCHQFNIPFEFLSQWDLAKGMYQQLARNTPNNSPPGYKNKNE